MQYGLGLRSAVLAADLLRLKDIDKYIYERLDVQLALLHHEVRLAGQVTAIARLKNCLNLPNLSSAEKSLLVFDLVEIFVRRGQKISDPLQALVVSTSASDSYEAALKEIALGTVTDWAFSDTLNSLSIANRIRLTSLAAIHSPDSELKQELRSRLAMLIESTPAKSRLFWQKLVAEDKSNEPTEIFLEGSFAIAGNSRMPLNRQRFLIRLAELFRDESELDYSKITQRLWGADFNESYYHRIRVLATRWNKQAGTSLGVRSVFIVERDRLRRSDDIRLTSRSPIEKNLPHANLT
jgi:hypothetical protein